MEKTWPLKKRNLNKKQKRWLEILKNRNEQSSQALNASFLKKLAQEKSQSMQQQQPNQCFIMQQPQNPNQNIWGIAN